MSQLEETLIAQIRILGLPAPEREVRFHPVRRWRFDLAWSGRKLAAEVEGGTWVAGRHSRGKGLSGDCEKYNEAVLAGWRVLRFPADQIRDGRAITLLERVLR